MSTPIIQQVIEKNSYKISKTILIDECISIGAALLGNFYNGNFPIKYLKNAHGYKDFKNHKKFRYYYIRVKKYYHLLNLFFLKIYCIEILNLKIF